MGTPTAIDDVLADLVDEYERLEAILATFTAELWTTPSGAPGWSVGDVVLHLALTEEGVADTLTRPDTGWTERDRLVSSRTSVPITPGASRTGAPVSLPRRLATGCIDQAGSGPPGRPRCETRTSLAPRRHSSSIVGSAARIRVSSATLTGSSGGDRSQRHVEISPQQNSPTVDVHVIDCQELVAHARLRRLTCDRVSRRHALWMIRRVSACSARAHEGASSPSSRARATVSPRPCAPSLA